MENEREGYLHSGVQGDSLRDDTWAEICMTQMICVHGVGFQAEETMLARAVAAGYAQSM